MLLHTLRFAEEETKSEAECEQKFAVQEQHGTLSPLILRKLNPKR